MAPMTAAQLADHCRALREAAGLTQDQLAQRLGGVLRQAITAAEDPNQPSRIGIRIQIIQELSGRTVEKVVMYRIV